MSTELRFLEKVTGERILQMRETVVSAVDAVMGFATDYEWTPWEDVPMVIEDPNEIAYSEGPGVNVSADNPYGDPPDMKNDHEA